MKRACCLVIVFCALLLCVSSVAAGQFRMYRLDGTPVDLKYADSVVAISLATTGADFDLTQFALERPELIDQYNPWALSGGLYVFGVEDGLDIDSVLSRLRSDTRTLLVNPVLDGELGGPVWIGDQMVVQFYAGVTSAQADSLHALYALSVDKEDAWRHFVTIRSDLDLGVLDVADAYMASGLCRFAEPNFMYGAELFGVSSPDTAVGGEWRYAEQWYYVNDGVNGAVADADIDADSAWMVTLGDPSVRIAILDVGFDLYHEDIDTNTTMFGIDFADCFLNIDTCRESSDVPGTWAVMPTCLPPHQERCGHGTAILGLLAAAHENGMGIRGLSPWCRFRAIKIYDDDYMQTSSTLAAHALGWAYEVDSADVISCSWGGGTYSGLLDTTLMDIRAGGCLVVFASGNDSVVAFPARLPTVLAVGASDDADQIHDYSGRGGALDFVAPTGESVSVTSAVDMWSWDMTGYEGYVPAVISAMRCGNDSDYVCKLGGTSMAAPQVAGVAGLILSRRPDFKDSTDPAGLIEYVLTGSSEDLGPPGFDTTFGHGRVNAYRALLSLIHGDVNNDGWIDVVDLSLLIDMVFYGASATLDDRTGDVDCSGFVDAADLGPLIDYINFSGPPPAICFAY